MRTIDTSTLDLLASPQIRLIGPIDAAMYETFREQLGGKPPAGPIAVAMTTLGGDPDVARAMADDIRLLRECDNRTTLFLGKATVYSAGTTFMAGFPVGDRYLTRNTRIMIHERSLDKTLELSGPLSGVLCKVKQTVHEIEQSIAIEEEGFRAIVKGSKIPFETLRERAPEAWYMDCQEALELGLIADVI
jgi:ATP-dependent protease ClpP protease subunit